MLRASTGGMAFGARGVPHAFQNGGRRVRAVAGDHQTVWAGAVLRAARRAAPTGGSEEIAAIGRANWMEFRSTARSFQPALGPLPTAHVQIVAPMSQFDHAHLPRCGRLRSPGSAAVGAAPRSRSAHPSSSRGRGLRPGIAERGRLLSGCPAGAESRKRSDGEREERARRSRPGDHELVPGPGAGHIEQRPFPVQGGGPVGRRHLVHDVLQRHHPCLGTEDRDP